MKIGIDIGTQRILNRAFKKEHNKDVILWEVLPIKTEQTIRLRIISKNSPHRQGIWFATDQQLNIANTTSSQIDIWEDSSPKELTMTCISQAGLLSFYNIYDKGQGRRSQSDSSGMIIEQNGATNIYHCNDFGFSSVFDKLIFSIELV